MCLYRRKTLQSLPGFDPCPLLAAVLLVERLFSMGKWMDWTRALCILCTDSQQMLGNNLWSFNCMDCIAASWRPSARIPGFSSGILICIYCTVAIQMDVYWKELLQVVLELLHGQIKEQIVPKLGHGLVVWWFWAFSLFSFPSNVDSQGWEGPWNVITAAVR